MSLAFLQGAGDASDLTTYTFASQNLGTADANRYIIVCAQGRAATDRTISSITVQGISSSAIVSTNNGGNAIGIAIFAVPTGTTGDIVVAYSDTMLRSAIQVFSVIGVDSTTPHDSGTSTAASPTYDIDVPAGGFAIGTAVAGTTGGHTWTGLTANYSEITESAFRASAASESFVSTQTDLTVSVSVGAIQPAGVFVSWGPAATGGAVPVFVNHYRQQGIM